MAEDNKKSCSEECKNASCEINEERTCDTVNEPAAEQSDSKGASHDKKKTKKADAEIERLKAELQESNDKYLRLYAEYDNFRKRSTKERENIYTDAYFDALLQILPVLDNLERAAQFKDDGSESQLARGLELTLKSFIETMNKMGVYEIEALGKEFDPNLHNAVMHVDDENEGENKIVEVFMKGYAKGDKVLRYSMVKVAN